MSSIKNIAVIGIGVIGTGWIIRFLYNQKKIKVYDPNLEQKKNLLKEIKKYIKAGSVIDFSKDLSSNKFNKPKINESVIILRRLI